MPLPSRDAAWALVTEHTKDPRLLKHMLAVEACMRFYARKFGEDEELWGITGLVHDFDYEQGPSPESHPQRGAAILRELGYPEELVYAVLSHANYLQHIAPRVHLLDKALFACDELSNFVIAVAYVRPGKSIYEVDVEAVKKKLKDKRFAAGVSREDVYAGAELLGLPLEEHIQNVIDALKPVAGELGIAGTGGA